MTYYTAVQPVLLLRAMRVTTKAISRIGGWGRIMAEAVRFELTGRYQRPTVFKTVGINLSPTLPCCWLRRVGIEPTTSWL